MLDLKDFIMNVFCLIIRRELKGRGHSEVILSDNTTQVCFVIVSPTDDGKPAI